VIFRGTKNSIIDKIAPIARNICPILAFSGFPESLGSSGFLHMDSLANQGMLGWDQIRKFIPLDWSVIFRWTKKSSVNKIAFIGRNTCPILEFNGFPESPGSSASFLYGRFGKSEDWITSEKLFLLDLSVIFRRLHSCQEPQLQVLPGS
jgi:hypothetical protein